MLGCAGALMVRLKAIGYATLTTSLPGQERVMTTCPHWHSFTASGFSASRSTHPEDTHNISTNMSLHVAHRHAETGENSIKWVTRTDRSMWRHKHTSQSGKYFEFFLPPKKLGLICSLICLMIHLMSLSVCSVLLWTSRL